MTALPLQIELPHDSEETRLAVLDRYDVLDTPSEPAFDRIATLIRLVFGVETSLVTMIDGHRQWYKAAQGTPNTEVPLGEVSAATPSRTPRLWSCPTPRRTTGSRTTRTLPRTMACGFTPACR